MNTENDPGDEQPEPVSYGWMMTVMPDGYRVMADPVYDERPENGLFGLIVNGTGEQGERVTVSGRHIARVTRQLRRTT